MIINTFNETICAPATSSGTGAVSIVRVSGPDAIAIADKVIRLKKGTVTFLYRRRLCGDLLSRFKLHSATHYVSAY